MKIINFSLDRTILARKSNASSRLLWYESISDLYTVVVPFSRHKRKILSPQIKIYGVYGSNKIFTLLNIYRLARVLIRKNNYDLITSQDSGFLGLLAWWLAYKYKLGFEVQIHGFENQSFLRRLVQAFVLKRASSIRVVSDRLAQLVSNQYKVDLDKITVVPIFVPLSGKRIINKPSNPFVLLSVNRLVPVKNIYLQLKALANLSLHFSNIRLWVVGSGPEEKKLKLYAHQLGISDKVNFWGYQNNLKKFYRRANAFVLTSNNEGWGMVAIEAASFGLPIVMTDVGCAGFVIKNNESGLVVKPGDEGALTEALFKIISDSKLANSLGKEAVKEIKKLPSLNQTLMLYQQSFQKALLK